MKPSPRVAYLLPAPGIPVRGPSGASAHARAFAAALARQADSRVYAALTADGRGRYGAELPHRATGAPRLPAPLRKWPELREIRAARRVARAVLADSFDGWRPDLLVERHALFSDAAWRAADRLGIPWVLEVNAPPVRERRRYEHLPHPRLAVRWEREVLLAAPALVAVSRWLVRWLREELGCRRVAWVPNGTGLPRGNRARGRLRLGLGPADRAIGYVGSFPAWHDISAASEVARRLGARLVLVGRPRVAPIPEDALATGHLEGQHLADVVAALDVGLAPFKDDAPPWFSPLKILDYRSQGTPVVASDVGDAAILLRGGGTAVPPGDVDAMTDAVRSWLGRRCRPRRRSWDAVVRQVLAFGMGGAQAQR